MSDADIGYGAKFGIEDPGTPGTYIDKAEVTRIKPAGFTRDEEDATHLQSPDMMKEFIPALMEATPVEFDINWKPSADDGLLEEFIAAGGNYQITAPNGVRMQFPGFFLSYEPGDLTNGKMTATVTVRPTGLPTLLAAV
ncbi:phage tail tube protein [Chachezhania antarctica]|uniref:phage tail tube protein n=1 Tax=Chachezhania antarctica TaxID=2340860 RepID=UPI000EB0BB2B|nr:phage tail tube protein [Chachezhania antarctica]|tara:strand:+ start:1266 stop:1682 length:417 start_codon:yes stop_codon:yes gene_type:complete